MSETNLCPRIGCGKPIADTAYICRDCTQKMARDILVTATRWRHMEDAIARALVVDYAPGKAKATNSHIYAGPWCWGADCEHQSCRTTWRSIVTQRVEKPGANEEQGVMSFEASSDAWAAGNTFATWARHISEERGIDIPAPTPPARKAATTLRHPEPKAGVYDPDALRLCTYSWLPIIACACGRPHSLENA